jgi:hypothetical protein
MDLVVALVVWPAGLLYYMETTALEKINHKIDRR